MAAIQSQVVLNAPSTFGDSVLKKYQAIQDKPIEELTVSFGESAEALRGKVGQVATLIFNNYHKMWENLGETLSQMETSQLQKLAKEHGLSVQGDLKVAENFLNDGAVIAILASAQLDGVLENQIRDLEATHKDKIEQVNPESPFHILLKKAVEQILVPNKKEESFSSVIAQVSDDHIRQSALLIFS